MLQALRILTFAVCIFFIACTVLFGESIYSGFADNLYSDDIQGEQITTSVQILNETSFQANVFLTVSSRQGNPDPVKLAFKGIKADSVMDCSISDSVFFGARYLREADKHFHDDLVAERSWESLRRSIGDFSAYLFEQPFWSMHLAFKLPTSLLEWQLGQKNPPAGLDIWSEIYDTSDSPPDNDLTIETELSKSPLDDFTVSYILPVTKEKLNTRGLMISYSASFESNQAMLDALFALTQPVGVVVDDNRIFKFRVKRIYVNCNDIDNSIYPEHAENFSSCEQKIVNRINSHETGVFVSYDILNIPDVYGGNKLLQKLILYLPITPHSEEAIRWTNAMPDFDPQEIIIKYPPTRPDTARILLFAILKGLLIWVVMFYIFHRGILSGSTIASILQISLTAYLIYMLVSTLFCFMFGFGFLLGVVAMESWVKTKADNISGFKLFVNGVMTSFFVAVIHYLLSNYSI